jgi:hypothetical protein
VSTELTLIALPNRLIRHWASPARRRARTTTFAATPLSAPIAHADVCDALKIAPPSWSNCERDRATIPGFDKDMEQLNWGESFDSDCGAPPYKPTCTTTQAGEQYCD